MTLGMAVIGCGQIGAMRAAAAARTPDVALRRVCDVDASLARILAGRLACGMDTDWRAAVARDDVDVVVVSTPTHLHAEISQGAMEAGKHVLCEKPLAPSVDECRAMIATARARGVRLMTGFNHRRYPPMLKAKELIDAGLMGAPITFRGWIGHEAGERFLGSWVADPRLSGGGTLMDNGVHLIDLVRFFLGEVTAIQGSTTTARWPIHPVEDEALAILHTEGGAVASIMSSWTEWRGYRVWAEITGTEGSIAVQYPPMLAILAVRRNGQAVKRTRFYFPREQIVERLRSYRWTTIQTFAAEFRELTAAIKEHRAPRPDGYDGLRAVEVVRALYEASGSGGRVDVRPAPSVLPNSP